MRTRPEFRVLRGLCVPVDKISTKRTTQASAVKFAGQDGHANERMYVMAIEVDIPLPKRCLSCSFLYYIFTGEYAGMTMCQAMESKGMMLPDCLIDEWETNRPANCPIKE